MIALRKSARRAFSNDRSSWNGMCRNVSCKTEIIAHVTGTTPSQFCSYVFSHGYNTDVSPASSASSS